MKKLLSLTFAFLTTGWALGAEAPAAGGASDPASIVVPTLLADKTAIAPNSTITLGVLYKVAPGWHIYWKNPGASGLATKVEWGLPAGWSVAETQYPTPIMFESPGPITSFGYEGEVLLMTEVRTPEKIEGDVQITAKTRWLMCSDRCIPGKKDLTLTLKSGQGSPANAEVFAKYRQLLPKKVSAAPANVKVQSTGEGEKTNVHLTVAPAAGASLVAEDKLPEQRKVYFFPDAQEGFVIEAPQVNVQGSGPATISYVVEKGSAAAAKPRVSGVLVYQENKGGQVGPAQLLDLQLD